MSLLLDALKKAADDKKKATQSNSQSPVEIKQRLETSLKVNSSNETDDAKDALNLQLEDDDQIQQVNNALTDEELTLAEADIDVNETVSKIEADSAKAEELILERNPDYHDTDPGVGIMSDEALSMLIYKTNRDVKRTKRFFISGVLIVSMGVLVSGGILYYMGMQEEINSLERKHQIAMQSMRSKTNREKTPSKSEIIRNLVSESNLNDKVLYAKKHMPATKERSVATTKNNTKINSEKRDSRIVSIQKKKVLDPVGEKLDAAWLAYEQGKYSEASVIYKSVLNTENNNRDALLGLGAIAVINKDLFTAKTIYRNLLELDPRDPIATAALSSMHSDKAQLDPDKDYLLSMLQKNPQAHHLNFALGNIYAQQNKWELAQRYYFNAWQNDSDNADYIFNLAVSMDQLNKPEQAVGFYQQSLLKASDKQVSFSRSAVEKRITELVGL